MEVRGFAALTDGRFLNNSIFDQSIINRIIIFTKAPFGTQKALEKGKKLLRKMISHVWFHSGKYKRKSNINKISQNFQIF